MGICGDKGGYRGKFDPINSVVYRDPILMIGTLRALGRTVAEGGLAASGGDGLSNLGFLRRILL